MIRCECVLVGSSPLSFSRPVQSKRNTGEQHDDFEERTWRERIHVDEHGVAFIPPMAIKNCLSDVAKYLSESVPGKGKATYTKHFTSGVLVADPVVLPVLKDDLDSYAGPMSSTGEKGKSGGRVVIRIFPIVNEWSGDVAFHILDEVITPDIFRQVVEIAGRNIGIGRFRPQNGGFNGRWTVEDVKWVND